MTTLRFCQNVLIAPSECYEVLVPSAQVLSLYRPGWGKHLSVFTLTTVFPISNDQPLLWQYNGYFPGKTVLLK